MTNDEMVEKARAWLKNESMSDPDVCHCKYCAERYASLARSAVRDALDEAIAMVKKLPRSFSNIAAPSKVCAKAVVDLSALRKKFEVEECESSNLH